ncbi:MAG TPA: hypothetical protein VK177_01820 [Flavobacteriales bacterium]|nr:hypothetical protein [Flavobacteriales bacterium]
MYNTSQIEILLSRFKDLTLAKTEWTHHAHVIVAAGFIREFGIEKAVPLIREGIIKYNVASGGENTDTAGYHETITMFWIAKVHEFICTNEHITDLTELIGAMLDGEFNNSNYPLNYYSKDFLMSTDARKNFRTPDLKAMRFPAEIG